MRVITGSARGRRLTLPEGREFRPTTDKVKESLFNIIQFEIEGRNVLDLFAGSGQLGIEAISRGAERAVFVDSSKRSLDILKQNIAVCGFEKSCSVFLSDAAAFLSSCREHFDLVFLDPPYHNGLCDAVSFPLEAVLKSTSVVICETGIDEELPDRMGGLPQSRVYNYSQIKLTVFRNGDETEEC